MSSLLHTFQSSYLSKKGITCSPTTIYCYRIYRSFSHMQTRLAILLPYRDNNGSCTFLRKAPGKHGSYKFFDSFLLSPAPHKKIFWGNSSESAFASLKYSKKYQHNVLKPKPYQNFLQILLYLYFVLNLWDCGGCKVFWNITVALVSLKVGWIQFDKAT